MLATTYTNPLTDGGGADPWVLFHEEFYYLVLMKGDVMQIRKSANLGDFHVEPITIFTPPEPFTEVWAPELHRIDGQFWIYVAMDKNKEHSTHRMYVLRGTSSTDPTQPFELVGQIGTPDDNWAIDGTVMQYPNGEKYFIWSGWTNPKNELWQNLYIAKMDGPTKTVGERVLLHEPLPKWHQSGDSGVNEGAQIIVRQGRVLMVYSVAGSWTGDYALAIMGIDNGADPLVVSNWWKNDESPVFSSSDVAFGTGHASFVNDRKGDPYIVYHAMERPDAGWEGRTPRLQRFEWSEDGLPEFPVPVGFGVKLPAPV